MRGGVMPPDTSLSKTARKYTCHFRFYDATFIGILKNDVKYTYIDFFSAIKKRKGG